MSQFVALCDKSLQAQISAYVVEEAEADKDAVGLRQQRVTVDKLGELTLLPDRVSMDYYVEYNGMSGFAAKNYTGAFAPTLTFAELKPYLRPDSPLQRLPAATARP